MTKLFNSIEQWVDYIDGVCEVLCLDFNIFKKELVLKIKITDQGNVFEHQLVFKNIASLYFNGGEGISRFEKIAPEEINWQIFEFSYHPDGIGNFGNNLLEEYNTNANFIICINSLLIAVEAYNVSFDLEEFILRGRGEGS